MMSVVMQCRFTEDVFVTIRVTSFCVVRYSVQDAISNEVRPIYVNQHSRRAFNHQITFRLGPGLCIISLVDMNDINEYCNCQLALIS